MAAPTSELGWVVHFAPVVRFTPLSPILEMSPSLVILGHSTNVQHMKTTKGGRLDPPDGNRAKR